MDAKKQSEEPSSSSQSPTTGFQENIDSAYSSECSSQLSRADYELERTIGIKIQNDKLWKSFSKIGNEMIVTKPGR